MALGMIDPAAFAGGTMTLKPALSKAALAAAVGDPLGMSPETAAYAVHEMVCENMASAARVHAVERGEIVSEHTLIAFGGAAPLHAARVAEKLGLARVLVPPNAGVGSAVGFLVAPISYELVKSRHMRLDNFDSAGASALLAEMSRDARALVEPGARGAPVTERRIAYMRYVGQGHEITVPLPVRDLDADDAATLRETFEREYSVLFRRPIPGAAIEALSWSVLISTKAERPGCDERRARAARAVAGRQPLVLRRPRGQSHRRAALPARAHGGGRAGGGTRDHRRGRDLDVRHRQLRRAHRRRRVYRDGAESELMKTDATHLIDLQIMWNRLIAVVEEQAQVLMRTAFSPIVRECGDLSAGVFDRKGRMLAQAVTGTPGHVNSMAESVKHFIRHFPLETMKPGDAYITNDPWMGTGHLNDFVITTPAFNRKGELVALFSCTSHLMDIGGIGFGPDATDVFMEGLYIPMLKLIDQGTVNETLMAMIRANTRLPIDTEGDTYSLAACNDVGAKRLAEMMEEFGIDSLDVLAEHICARSREAVLAEIGKLPRGTWHNSMTLDGYDAPVTLQAALTISDEGIHVDYTGTSGQSRYGINVPLSYTTAYTVFGLGCVVASQIPNNAGSLGPLTVSAPLGAIVNAPKPAPVCIRHVIGQMLPDVVFGCLKQIIPDRVPAEGTSCLWNLNVRGETQSGAGGNYGFMMAVTSNGGTGARPDKDGLSATAYPSGVRGTPVEIAESQTPLIFWKKELRPGSGGVGRTQGGHGQIIEIGSGVDRPWDILAAFDRIDHPPRGRDGGHNGAAGYIGLKSGKKMRGKGFQEIPPGDRLVVHTPGGGGIGAPDKRKSESVVRDLADELISEKTARDLYGFTPVKAAE